MKHTVEVGNVYRDRDPREVAARELTVQAVDDQFAYCLRGRRRVRILKSRLLTAGKSSGYDLVSTKTRSIAPPSRIRQSLSFAGGQVEIAEIRGDESIVSLATLAEAANKLLPRQMLPLERQIFARNLARELGIPEAK